MIKKKDFFRKTLIITALSLCLILLQTASVYSPENPLVSGNNFSIILNEGDTLVTGASSEFFVNFTVSSGVLNGTDATFVLYEKSGKLTFISENNSIILFTALNDSRPLNFQTTAESQKLAAFHHSIIISESASRVVISWRFGQATFTNWEFFFGMAGVIIMICAPCWFAIKLRDGFKKADEIVERLVYAGILFAIGYSMMLIWLGAFV